MTPRPPDPAVRAALLEAAAALLAKEGPGALTTRRLAEEVGSSTMAVYTHFGGKDELLAATSVEGFRRLARSLGRVRRTDDPVADLFGLGRAYRRNALANPDLYRVMFGASPASAVLSADEAAMTLGTFETLVHGTERCIAADRFDAGDPWMMAAQLWSASHGLVMLELAGFFPQKGAAMTCFTDMTTALIIGFGDAGDRARASVRAGSGRRR
jgi:AcrR family transcriptional regulator